MKHERNNAVLAQLVSYMHEGYTWQAAAALAGVDVSQSTAYRLYKTVRERGEAALQDGRRLLFRVQGAGLPTLDAQERIVA